MLPSYPPDKPCAGTRKLDVLTVQPHSTVCYVRIKEIMEILLELDVFWVFVKHTLSLFVCKAEMVLFPFIPKGSHRKSTEVSIPVLPQHSHRVIQHILHIVINGAYSKMSVDRIVASLVFYSLLLVPPCFSIKKPGW